MVPTSARIIAGLGRSGRQTSVASLFALLAPGDKYAEAALGRVLTIQSARVSVWQALMLKACDVLPTISGQRDPHLGTRAFARLLRVLRFSPGFRHLYGRRYPAHRNAALK